MRSVPGWRTILAKFGRNISKIDCKDHSHIWSPGVYIQDTPHIHIGRGCCVAPNAGIIATNHDPANPSNHLLPEDVYIGSDCWIGMNAVILPGVTLGDHTIVGAGSVVTHSFPDEHCVIAGNPAKKI